MLMLCSNNVVCPNILLEKKDVENQKFFYLTLIKQNVHRRVGDKNSSISLYHLFFSPRATLPLLLHARARTYYTRTRGEPRQTRWASRAKEKKKGQFEEREREREFSFHEKTQKRRNLKTKVKRGRPLEIAS